jgi:hypothetical protein
MPSPLPCSLDCFFCGAELPPLDPDRLPDRERLAYDPELGRLWRVCGECTRWNIVPLEDRWEVLEYCERLVRDDGELLVGSDVLGLYWIGGGTTGGQLVRVGRPPRLHYADWRYSERLDEFPVRRRGGWIARLLQLPERSVTNLQGGAVAGGDAYHPGIPTAWVGAPFIEHAALLTGLFADVPLAERCPSCGGPFVLEPYRLGDTRLILSAHAPSLLATCGLCGDDGVVPLADARAPLRAAIAIVERDQRSSLLVQAAVKPVERCGGAAGFIERLARRDLDFGSMPARNRLALWFCLDEQVEAEALEAEWRRAEELESILDRELTDVPAFEEFRARIRAPNP